MAVADTAAVSVCLNTACPMACERRVSAMNAIFLAYTAAQRSYSSSVDTAVFFTYRRTVLEACSRPCMGSHVVR